MTKKPLHAEDLELAAEALRGVPTARERFAERMVCVPKILTVMNARLGSALGDAELDDLVQDTLISIWRRLDGFEGLASLETWSYRFCQNELANRLRSRTRRRTFDGLGRADVVQESAQGVLDFEHVHQALDRVPAGEATVVRLKHFEHLRFDDIGERLGISPNTAKTRYYRALDRMRTLLEPLRREVGW